MNAFQSKQPNFFIVGAPKSATTSLDYYLGQHPEIFMSPKKELHYFGNDLISKKRTGAGYALEHYLSFFEKVQDERIIGESSVLYLCSKSAPFEIKEFCPEAKIIIILRNPVDMMYALHSQLLSQADEDIEDFEQALAAENERKEGRLIPRRVEVMDDGLIYREVANYLPQVKRYFDCFGRENVHVIIFEDIKKNVAQVYCDTLKFLGANDIDFQPDFLVVNANKQVRSRLLQEWLRWPSRRMLVLAKLFFPRTLLLAAASKLMKLNVSNINRPPLGKELRIRLQGELSDNVRELGTLLNKDLSHWTN